MELIGFVENKQIPRHHYMSKSIAICAEPGNDRAAAMLSALNQALRTCNCKAVVRSVFECWSEYHFLLLLSRE